MRDSSLSLKELNPSDLICVLDLGEYLSRHARLGTEFAQQGGAETPDFGDDGGSVDLSESLTVTTSINARSAIV